MKLILADNTSFTGQAFGAQRDVQGEVAFNTAMTGYVEALTDPSYRGQILVLTYPLQGNYGVPDGPFESLGIQVQGLVVSHYSEAPHHHAARRTLSQWLQAEGIPAIYGVDTRAITRHLREYGTIEGALLTRATAEQQARNSSASLPALVGRIFPPALSRLICITL
jgi:carbamoyl-phosphate synthase small subunit